MASFGTLTITGQDGTSHVVALDRPEIIIGRDVGSDIMLDDPQASRFHARINCGPDGCAIADLVSSNGTLVNGQRISGPVDISGGAAIQIGGYTLVFQPGLAVAGAAPTASLPYRSAPTIRSGYGPLAEARRANPLVVVVGTAAVVVLLGMLCCGASYLLGIDALVSPGLRAVSGVLPGLGAPLSAFYGDLHTDQQVGELGADPTVTPTPNEIDTAQPAPEETSEAGAATPEATSEATSDEASAEPPGPTLAPSITVRNESNLAFCGAFIRASGQSFWGDNRLTTGQMPVGDHQLITIPGPGTYDIRVMDCSSPRITLENKLNVEVSEPYEWVVDSRFTLPPTATPTATVTPTPEATPIIDFYADDTSIDQGECTDVHWSVENISAVYFQNDPVVGHDSRKVCPNSTKTYTLRVIYRDNSEHNFKVTVEVIEPSPTP